MCKVQLVFSDRAKSTLDTTCYRIDPGPLSSYKTQTPASACAGRRSATLRLLHNLLFSPWSRWRTCLTAPVSLVAKELDRILSSRHSRDPRCLFFKTIFGQKSNDCPPAGQWQGARGQAFIEHLQPVMGHNVPEGSGKLHGEPIDTPEPSDLAHSAGQCGALPSAAACHWYPR